MKNMLFISFIDFGNFESGSSVRPQQMHQAFLDLGYEVKLLSSAQNKRKERTQKVKETLSWLDHNKPDFCYIESPSGPIFNRADHALLKKLRKLNIPSAYFYRDAFWLFPAWWGVSGIKKAVLTAMYRIDLKILRKCCDIVYFPSASMAEHFDFKIKRVLPPAGEDRQIYRDKIYRNAIYVGGLSERYGTPILLRAFEIINNEYNENISLTLICREKERGSIEEKYRTQPWLHICSASGQNQLAPFYSQSDIGIYAGKRDMYMDFAVPVKLFEYISYGLPVVTTDCVEAKRIVEQGEFGRVCQDNPESLAYTIIEIYNNPYCLAQYSDNAAKQIKNQHLWVHRAKQVADDLAKYSNRG